MINLEPQDSISNFEGGGVVSKCTMELFSETNVDPLCCATSSQRRTLGFEDENDYEICLQVFSRILKKEKPRKASLYLLFTKKLALLNLLKEVKPSPVRKMAKLLTLNNLFPPRRHFRYNP